MGGYAVVCGSLRQSRRCCVWSHASLFRCGESPFGSVLLLLLPTQLGQLLHGNDAQEVSRCGVRGVDEAHPHRVVLPGLQLQLADGETLT